MTAHTHVEYVQGCYRCDLSRDETATALYAVSREALAALPNFWDHLIDSGAVKVIDCPHKRCPCACHLEDVP